MSRQAIVLTLFLLLFALHSAHKRSMAKEGTPSSLRLTEVFKLMIKLLMRERHFNDRTAYFEQMVRDDWDKRATPQMQAELNALLAKAKSEPEATTPPKSKASWESEVSREPSSPAKSGTRQAKGTKRKKHKFGHG